MRALSFLTMPRIRNFVARVACTIAMVAAVLAPAVVWAQDAVPQPELRRAPATWLGYLFMVILIAAVMAVSLLPSKRGHQD